jgi:hypothetical protein
MRGGGGGGRFYKTMMYVVEKCIDIISIYNIKINLMTPKIRLSITYRNNFWSNGQ